MNKKTNTAMAAACVGMLLVGTAHAQAYRSDVGASVERGEICVGSYTPPDDYTPPTGPVPPDPAPPTGSPAPPAPATESGDCVDDYSGFAVSGSVFLNEVDTSRGPLELAPYVSRASNIGGSYGRYTTDDSDVDIDTWDVFGRFVTEFGLVIEASVGSAEFDGNLVEIDVDQWRVAGGYYIAQDTQIRLAYSDEDADTAESERWAIDITHVQQLENGMTWSVNALAGWVTQDIVSASDDGNDYLLNTQWFFNDQLGVGVNIEIEERDRSGDFLAYEIFGQYFLTEKISLNLTYRNEEFDDLNIDTDSLVFAAHYRF